MPTIPEVYKQQLLAKTKQQGMNANLQELVPLIDKYDNLNVSDFKTVLPAELLAQLKEQCPSPGDTEWNNLASLPEGSLADLQEKQRRLKDYIARNAMSEDAHVDEARDVLDGLNGKMEDARIADVWNRLDKNSESALRSFLNQYPETGHRSEIETLLRQIGAAKEAEAWEKLDKEKYSELLKYLTRYPETIHRDEIDDLVWATVTNAISVAKLDRYCNDLPSGKHVAEANKALDSYAAWEEVKRMGDIIHVKDYIDNYPDSLFLRDAKARYFTLRDEEVANMKESPADYNIDKLQDLFNANIFSKLELMDEGLITERSWEKLTEIDRDMLPKIDQTPDPNVSAPADCTDIFFFGTPATGKTCLLMGLAGANGQGYSLDTTGKGGQYISDLTIYANNGITPKSTFGSFVTVINGYINEETKKGNIVRHNVNLVEMSGEEFAMKIAQNPDNKVSFENMGTGATKLLMNDNRKVFFIIVDPTKNMIPFRYQQEVKDDDGQVVDTIVRKTYIAQDIILSKLTSLFTHPDNAKIMEKVDAIHFIVTKADTLDEMRSERRTKAGELVRNNYGAAVGRLKDYVRMVQRINRSTNFNVNAYTFSLGRFFLGDIFEVDPADTRELISTIRDITFGHRELTVWDRIKNILN